MIFTSLNKLIDELKQKFEVTDSFNSPIQNILYETSKEEVGYNVKKLFDGIYSIHNGFNLLWKDDNQVLGESSLPRMTSIFASTSQQRLIYIDNNWDGEFKIFTRQFYPLDIYKEALDSVSLTVVNIIDEDSLELWIWNNAGQKYKLKFKSIEEYLEAGIVCKFIICWQYFYIDTEAIGFNGSFNKQTTTPNFGDAISNMETALESLKKYFPGENWSYQEKELERVKQLE